uniref:Mucin-5AC n=1 Tax=Globodera rostochiensis TaxID=31243 RepID=A0A914I566_GLORO
MGQNNNGRPCRTQLVVAWAHRLIILLLLACPSDMAHASFSWPRARIPFEDDPRLLVDPDQAVALNNARMDLQVRTCIRLVPRRGESDYAYFTDLGPHIECWNMFEPFPPKGRILVNAGISCLEPMRRPHRPRRVFSDCDIEYVNHLYNCPRRRKSSPICPAGRLIMAKPIELRQQRTTTIAGDEEEMDATTSTRTTTAAAAAAVAGMEEEGEEGQGDEEEGAEGMNTTTAEMETELEENGDGEEEEVADGRDGAVQPMEGPEAKESLGSLQNAASTTVLPSGRTESEMEFETVDEMLGTTMTTIHESVEDITLKQSQEHLETTTTAGGEETMPEGAMTSHATALALEITEIMPEATTTTSSMPEATTFTTITTIAIPQPTTTAAKTAGELPKTTTTEVTMPNLTTAMGTTVERTSQQPETTEPSTTPMQHSTTFFWTTMLSSSSASTVPWPIITDRTIVEGATTVDAPPHPQDETELPLRHPLPLMMTLITTTTTTTIAPPPPDWVRSVEESFRAGDGDVGRKVKSTTTTTRTRTSSSTSEEEKQPSGSNSIEPPKPRPIRPDSEQSVDVDEKSSRPVVVGVIQIPSGSGFAIREKTKITKVVEKTKYIGPCGSACHYDGQLVRLYRSANNNPPVMDHFYTTERLEQHLMAAQGFVMEPSMGFLGRNQIDPNCTCIRPLYRLYSEFAKDHFLTASEQEKSIAEGLLGYVHERILGYCTNEPGCGAYVPLYRFFSAVNRDHFYTADQQEMHYYKTHAELTYAFEKIECYVWQHSASARGCPAVPLLEEREQRLGVKTDEFRRQQR